MYPNMPILVYQFYYLYLKHSARSPIPVWPLAIRNRLLELKEYGYMTTHTKHNYTEKKALKKLQKQKNKKKHSIQFNETRWDPIQLRLLYNFLIDFLFQTQFRVDSLESFSTLHSTSALTPSSASSGCSQTSRHSPPAAAPPTTCGTNSRQQVCSFFR